MTRRMVPGGERARGGAALRVVVAVVLVWVVAAVAGVPLAVDLAGRAAQEAQSLGDRTAETVRRLVEGRGADGGSGEPGESGSGEPGAPGRSGGSGGSGRDGGLGGGMPGGTVPPPEQRLPRQRQGGALPPPAGTPSGVRDALAGVVQVVVARCGAGGAGSGFVAAPGRVVTNAHVVQGATRVRVLPRTGAAVEARVVEFDEGTDVAVLAVDGLDAPALRPASPASAGDEAWVAGHPLGGPLRVVGARVAGTAGYRSPDRATYVLQTRVRPGNSGGPLLDARGDVLGIVFATAADGDPVGYARTWDAVSDEVARGLAARASVGTGSC